MATQFPVSRYSLAALLIFVLAFTLWLSLDAFRLARRTGIAKLGRYNRIGYYILFIVFSQLLAFGFRYLVSPDELGISGPSQPKEPIFPMGWQSFSVPSRSMEPTILEGDYFVADRKAFQRSAPRAGDLVVFPALPSRTNFVKRIVGLPGDRVQIRQGQLYLNDVAVKTKAIGPTTAEGTPMEEELPNGRRYRIIAPSPQGHPAIVNTRVFTVPEGQVFVLGDKRGASMDSRMDEVGTIPIKDLQSSPRVIFWSSDRTRIGTELE